MIKIILIAVFIILAIVLIYAATKPDTFHVERSISIKAPPEKIFPFINDFHLWNEWTPYNKDPAMKKILSGSASGKGAAYAWEGNKDVGKGDITITSTTPPNKAEFDLHMIEPFEGHNTVVFTLHAAGDATNVTWSLDGTQNFIAKILGMFLNMDKMVGKDFEVGLGKLKSIAEK
jgi:hypothetical protein